MKCAFSLCSTLFVVSAGLASLPHSLAYAVTTNGIIAFAQPPSLVIATTPYDNTNVRGATYYFTLELPATAGEPLQRVTFTQTEGTDSIRFDKKDTYAFEGTREHQGARLSIKSAPSNYQKQITVTFDRPVPPGKIVTIGLRPVRNPTSDGVYLFRVTAFPAGQKTSGQFIGVGRLQFYTEGN